MAACAPDGQSWGSCTGEVTPQPKTCATTADVACDGLPCVVWAEGFGPSASPGFQQVQAVALDPTDGSTVIVGELSQTMTFGSTVVSATSSGQQTLFVTRLAADGTVMWAKPFVAEWGCAVAVDESHNVYVGGRVNESTTIGQSPLTAGDFVMQLDGTGAPIWARNIGNAPVAHLFQTCQISAAAIASDGNLLVAGVFANPVDFGDGQVTLPGNGYVAKLNSMTGLGSKSSTGPVWAQLFQGAVGPQIGVDGAGAVHVGATLAGTTYWPGESTVTTITGSDVAIASYDMMGNLGWSQRFSNGMPQTLEALAVDSFGDVVIAGQIQGTLSFLGSTVSATSTQGDGYAVRLNQGSPNPVYGWGKTFGTNGEALGVGLDSNGNARVLGWFTGTLAWGGTALPPQTTRRMLLAELAAADGSSKWNQGWAYPGTTTSVYLAVAPAGDSFVGGTLSVAPFNIGTGALIQATDQATGWAGRFAP
jgi:hypothetical protein